MTNMRRVTTSVLICVIAISQVAFAYAHGAMPLLREASQTVVICSATGPLEIEWPLGDTTPPDHPMAKECPLCTLGVAIAPPERSLTICDAEGHLVSYPILATSQPRQAEAAPYPARAPPN